MTWHQTGSDRELLGRFLCLEEKRTAGEVADLCGRLGEMFDNGVVLRSRSDIRELLITAVGLAPEQPSGSPRPLVAARHLLGMVRYPAWSSFDSAVPDTDWTVKTFLAHAKAEDVKSDVFDPTNILAQRRLIAGAAGRYGTTRGSLTPKGKGHGSMGMLARAVFAALSELGSGDLDAFRSRGSADEGPEEEDSAPLDSADGPPENEPIEIPEWVVPAASQAEESRSSAPRPLVDSGRVGRDRPSPLVIVSLSAVALAVLVTTVSTIVSAFEWPSSRDSGVSPPSDEPPLEMKIGATNRTTGETDPDGLVPAASGDKIDFIATVTNSSEREIDLAFLVVHFSPAASASDLGVTFEWVDTANKSLSAGHVISLPPATGGGCLDPQYVVIKRISTVTANSEVWADMPISGAPTGHFGKDAKVTGVDIQGDWAPGETKKVKVAVELGPGPPSTVDQYSVGGSNVTVRPPGQSKGSTTVTASPGAELVVDTYLHDSSCSVARSASNPLVRAHFRSDRQGFTDVSLTASDGVQIDRPGAVSVTLGRAIVNYRDGKTHRLRMVPGSTEFYEVNPLKCDAPPRLLKRLPDGVTQGGVVAGPVFGFVPRARCPESHGRWLRFRVKVD